MSSSENRPNHYTGLIDRYKDRLPVDENTPVVSLNEGDTPLVQLVNIPKEIGFDGQIYVKYEGLNPTASFKDRGMTMAVTKAAEEGAKAIVCASTGNTSAAAAAYAARAGMTAFVLIPEGKIAMGKLAQAIYRLQGQKTAAFEIVEALGRAPDYHCIPVGNAGNISGYWIGFSEACGHNTESCTLCNGNCPYLDNPMTDSRPVMVGYQADGAAPFLRDKPVEQPETLATAIRIGNPQSWDLAHAAVKESGGWFDEVSDEELLATQSLLAKKEGVFCEPASAVSLCGAMRDTDIAIRGQEAVQTVQAELEAVKAAILAHI